MLKIYIKNLNTITCDSDILNKICIIYPKEYRIHNKNALCSVFIVRIEVRINRNYTACQYIKLLIYTLMIDL